MTSAEAESTTVRTAVVIGAHPVEVPAFTRLFRGLKDVEPYVMTLEDWVVDMGGHRASGFYDVVVFYNFHQEEPAPSHSTWIDVRGAVDSLRDGSVGVLVLHHAILAYPTWSTWSELVGIDERAFTSAKMQTLEPTVATPHPITEGVADWELIDETYSMVDAGPGSEILLSVDHPRSMRTLGWTRSFGDARVFCLQSGHDHTALDDPTFRRVVQQAIRWLAGAAPERD